MKILTFLKNTFSSHEKVKSESAFARIIEAAYEEWRIKDNGNGYWSFKSYDTGVFANRLLKLTDKQKVAFITDAVFQISGYNKGRTTWHSHDKGWQLQNIRDNFLQHLLRTRLVLDENDIAAIIAAFSAFSRYDSNDHIICWPVHLLLNQVETRLKGQPATQQLRHTLADLKEKVSLPVDTRYERDQHKILMKIESLLFYTEKGPDAVQPVFFPGTDDFASYANQLISDMDESDKARWFRLMQLSQKAAGIRPGRKYLEESKTLFREFGTDRFKQIVNSWLLFLAGMKEKTEQLIQRHDKREYIFTVTGLLAPANIDMIRGFIWMCTPFHDKNTLSNMAALAERSFRKIPGKGPAAAAIGNACLYVLAHAKGMEGITHLSRLRLHIRQSSTQALIEKYMQEAAAGHGLSIHELEDMAVDRFGFEEGKRKYELGGYTAILKITGVGKTELSWIKPDGTVQKSEPAAIKQNYSTGLHKIKNTASQVELTLTAQRDRLDRMFRCNRSIAWPQFVEYYFSHGLMCYLTDLLIWNFRSGEQQEAAFFLEDRWVNHHNEELALPVDDDTVVSLWHPVLAAAEEINNWRKFMLSHKIMQPLKQAFREVCGLTQAEITMAGYSSRITGHLLKQHPFLSMIKARGWKYAAPGGLSTDGVHAVASTDLADHGLKAELCLKLIHADPEDAGNWQYVSTGQVRFIDIATETITALVQVSPVVFSEVMRDADLFVSMASVGNDAAWPDKEALADYRSYWHSYAFGKLTETAMTRKAVLESLLPQLSISAVAELKDQFLVVKGKLRTYRVHIGSTNILMEPNDEPVSLVPDKNFKSNNGKAFLPFDNDAGLFMILNKAFLLSEDDQLTDPVIARQIRSF